VQPDDPVLTVDEVARELRAAPDTVRRWLRQGKLRGFSFGSRKAWRIRSSELARFTAQQNAPTDP